ncbi:MAG: TIGR02530 family flagellar biosynthesis protein [Mahellales bacterium]|jgi:flagellar operon protein
MTDNHIINGSLRIGTTVYPGSGKNRVPSRDDTINSTSFHDILKDKTKSRSELKLSKHVSQRMMQRNISLSERDIQEIGRAVAKAEKKGVRDTLIIKDNMALIVSITNKTIITALDKESARENVFTNIDGAVII